MPTTRRRGTTLLRAIHQAALEELATRGLGGLTLDGVARRAGTSRTTLYRRWPGPESLVADAIVDALTVPQLPPDSGVLRDDLVTLFTEMRNSVTNGPAAAAIGAVLGDRAGHPDLVAAIRERMLQPGLDTIAEVANRAARRGEISPSSVTTEACAAGPAMMVVHLLLHSTGPDCDEIDRIVDHVVLPALRSATGAAQQRDSRWNCSARTRRPD